MFHIVADNSLVWAGHSPSKLSNSALSSTKCNSAERRKKKRNRCLDVCRGGEIFGVAANADSVLWLIDTNPVDAHRSRERNVIHVVPTKVE